MLEPNKALARRWMDEVWNHGNTATIDELFAPDGKAHGIPDPGSVVIGPSGFHSVHQLFNSAFSNIHMAVDHVFAEGDRVATQWTATMTHTGDALGFAPTGITVTIPGCSVVIIKDGKITEGWNYMDFTAVANKLQAAALKA